MLKKGRNVEGIFNNVIKTCIGTTVLLMLVLEIGCKDERNPVEPQLKDPRTLSWSADTIVAPYTTQTILGTIWGYSSHDVYLTGTTSNGAVLYHYDGANWTKISMPRSSRGSYDIHMIRGTNPNDIWLVGSEWYFNFSPPPNFFDSTLVLHFDGTSWTQFLPEDREGLAERLLVHGQNDVWVSGRKSLWNFCNGSWSRDTIPLGTSPEGFCGITGLALDGEGTVFVNFLYRPIDAGPDEQHYFFSRTNRGWKLLDSGVVQPSKIEYNWGYDNLWCNPSEGMYSLGYGVFRWEGSAWVLVEQGDYSAAEMASSDNGHLLVVGNNGTVLDFNGVDWYQFTQFKDDNVVYTDVWTDGKEVFIAGYENQGRYSIVLHGK